MLINKLKLEEVKSKNSSITEQKIRAFDMSRDRGRTALPFFRNPNTAVISKSPERLNTLENTIPGVKDVEKVVPEKTPEEKQEYENLAIEMEKIKQELL